MSLSIPAFPDPQGAPGDVVTTYSWIESIHLAFSDGTGEAVVWHHRTADAAATWADPALPNVPPMAVERFPVGGDVIPDLTTLATKAAELAASQALDPFGAFRAAVYFYVQTNRYPDATEVP